ncbi:odorant receptor 10-like isoform X1 [Onthophagus taurus]|uniref:odorant receptor 10-like isoform X1 n=1 Tax=Onthophagus taurus TaxID=166361 RepID=UPI0039BE1297
MVECLPSADSEYFPSPEESLHKEESYPYQGVIKIAVLLYYSKEIREMLDGLEKGVFYPNQKRGGKIETDLVKKCIIINNRQTFIYYFTVVAVCGIGCFGTMITRIFFGHKELPFMPFSWFDASESPYYEIVWFYQTYWRTSYALMVSSTDSLIAGILLHISTQCKILQNAVKRVIENAYNEAFGNNKSRSDDIDPSKIPWNILEKHIKLIINYHGDVIGLADKFEKLFSLLLLCVFAATLFILCFIMYHASLFDLISMRAAQDFSYVGVVTVQVFLYCFWGNEVRDESVKIADACWETNFVGTDVRFQKALASIIRRSQKPIVITAGKFSDLSLKSYVWLIRASYSYYMVLGNRQKKELEITL